MLKSDAQLFLWSVPKGRKQELTAGKEKIEKGSRALGILNSWEV